MNSKFSNKSGYNPTKQEKVVLAKLFGTTIEQIENMSKAEYRKLAAKYHPDKNSNPDAHLAFSIIGNIYSKRKL